MCYVVEFETYVPYVYIGRAWHKIWAYFNVSQSWEPLLSMDGLLINAPNTFTIKFHSNLVICTLNIFATLVCQSWEHLLYTVDLIINTLNMFATKFHGNLVIGFIYISCHRIEGDDQTTEMSRNNEIARMKLNDKNYHHYFTLNNFLTNCPFNWLKLKHYFPHK